MVQQLFPSALNATLEAIRVASFQLVTSKCLAVTAEAAGSSPVVPAILFKELSDVTPKTPTHNSTHSFY